MIKSVSTAVIVKIRSRYAKRLTNDEFDSLSSCSSVSDVASQLKKNPIYSEILSRTDNKEIRREFLESILNYSFLEDLSIIAKYDLSFEKNIFKYVITRFEVQQICKFLLFLKSHTVDSFECSFPSFFKYRSKIKFDDLNKAETYENLLDAIKKTDYYTILSKYNSNNFDINLIETSLYNYIFKLLLNSVSKFNHKISKDMKKILYNYIDISNIVRIVRSKIFYNAEDSYINDIIFKFGDYKFSKYDILNKSNFSNFDFINDNVKSVKDLEKFSKILRFKWSKKNIRYSNIAEIVGFSYIILKEVEISNLINIIEGVRYGLPKEFIQAAIIR